MMLNGMRVIVSEYLVENGKPIEVRRTWTERLLSWPWRPLVKTRTEVLIVPHSGCVQLDADTVVMHPETLKKLQEFERQVKPFVESIK